MKVTKVLLAFLFVLNASMASAEKSQFGLGLMVGSLVSVTGKYWLSKREALDFGLGFGVHGSTALYGDYLWHIPGIFGRGTRFGRETSGYIGVGAGIGLWSDSYDCGRWNCRDRSTNSGTGVFVRGLFGFEWYPSPTRFGVFAELGPTLLFVPSTSGSLDLGVGGRYYF